jgi:hypothetical protein
VFKNKIENLLGTTIKSFQCDGGTKFKPLMTQFPSITFRLSCPYTPEQNGLAERKHRHIVELGLASIPMEYWDLVFESVVFVINCIPSASNSISSFEALFHNRSNYKFFHVLGCACYPFLRPYMQTKLQPRLERCVFLGYSQVHKGYYCLDLSTK